MHDLTAYPMPYSFAAAPPRGGLIAYLRAATLSVWMFTLVYSYWWISTWYSYIERAEAGVNIRSVYYVGFAIALIAHLTMGIGAWFALPFTVTSTWSGRLLTLFCVLMFLLAPMSQVPKASALYAAATWGVYALLCLYWQNDYRVVQRMTVFAGMVIMGWLFILLAKHGLTSFGGAIGGITRNATGTAALGAMICCLLSPRKSLRWAAIAAAIMMAVVVSSRGSLVAMAAFFVVYYTSQRGVSKAMLYAFAVAIAVLIAFIASPDLQHFVFEDIFHLHDRARGLGSGFTGRVTMWQEAIDAFWKNPILGLGFRSTTHGTGGMGSIHSGYIKLLVETGFVGFFIIIAAVIIETVRRYRLAVAFRDLPPAAAPGIDVVETTRINAVACGALTMTMVVWIYEQLYINLGAVISLVFFLMMAAPAYITTQGTTLRR